MKIHFNIWDDYEDDEGYRPQDTTGYFEMSDDEMPEAEKEEAAKVIFNHLLSMGIKDVSDFDLKNELKIELDCSNINFYHLSHERREKLVEELQQANLKYNGKEFNIYSES